MKLVTIQTLSAYKSLQKNGYLIVDSKFVNDKKYGVPYRYIMERMDKKSNIYNAEYPLWAWVKYGSFVSPPKNKLLGFFPKEDSQVVRITFEKSDNEVLVTDYIKYHFLLTNEYLPKDILDKQKFDIYLEKRGITKEDLLAYVRRDKFDNFRIDEVFNSANKKIQKSYDRIFQTDGKFLQATVWDIKLSDIIKVEFIDREKCSKKASVDYRQMYIKSLKNATK